MFRFLGGLAVAHPGKICLAWVALGVLLTLIAPASQQATQDDDIRFLPSGTPSLRAHELLEKAFPQDVSASVVLFAIERTASPLSAEDFALVERLIARLQRLERDEPALQINGITSRKDALIGNRLNSADGHCTLIQVALATPYAANQTRVTVDRCEEVLRREMESAGPNPPQIIATGPAGVGRDLLTISNKSLDRTTIATVVLVVGVLLLVYRSPVLALVPLVTIGVSAWIALSMLSMVTMIPGVHLMNVSQIFAIVILFGAGTDYCLFLIARYREELERGRDTSQGVRRSVAAVGEALAASAGTVICGLAMMGFADFAKIRCAGPVIALALVIGLAASLTLTPALLQLTGAKAFWPGKIVVQHKGQRRHLTFWGRVSKLVARRPGWVWLGTFAVLLPFAVLGVYTKAIFSPLGDLSPSSPSVRGMGLIRDRFSAGEVGPITVLLASNSDWETPAGRKLIRYLSQGFLRLDNVGEVRSLTQPLGKPLDIPGAQLLKLLGKADPTAMVRARYLSTLPAGPERFVTKLDVVLKSDPFDIASIQTLSVIEHWLNEILPEQTAGLGAVRAEASGVTVHSRDLTQVMERDRLRVNLLVIAGVFLILWLVVKRAWLASYLLATVLFSYYATLGATALFAAAWLNQPLGSIEWRVPFFLFVILVAVGEDYNILMVTRAMQERRKHGAVKGIRRGLARTGGTITACGVIMAGTFATLMLAGLGTLVQIGFALAVGVLIDTLLIRPLLVPSFMLMVWRDEGDDVPAKIVQAKQKAA